jgi:gluconolactonase
MGTYDILDERFHALIIGHAKLEHLWTGARWSEGPVYVPSARHLIWSDIPNDRLLRFNEDNGSVSVFQQPCGFHNGHTLDKEGRIIACEHGARRISRLDHDGVWRTLCDQYEGKRLNSPNDVVVKSDGTIWFTDPTYGIDSEYEGYRAESEIGNSYVYRLDPRYGSLKAMITDRVKPNGLAFSRDEKTLYVSDTGATHIKGTPPAIHAYKVAEGDQPLKESSVFAVCSAGMYDGFRVDWKDNLWTSSANAVLCYTSDGDLIGRIPVPEIVGNLCFGGPNRNRLYIAGQTSLYSIFLNTRSPPD